ncbi:MAG: GNAT family N-acetyltransferase [Spirochaetales bacterium]|nr:GNAT family N-acetyltransferase [Spirochaetales bacterium]
MKVAIERIDENNKGFLREMLYQAIYVPEEEQPLPVSVLDDPLLSKYIEDWGKEGDFGIIALIGDLKAGAIWLRYFTSEKKGWGFIAESIPELSMAMMPEYRNRGLGTEMMTRFLDLARERGISCISISVDKRNRAVHFYQRIGFVLVRENEEDFVMKILL